jgi:Uma2 family endonuclease
LSTATSKVIPVGSDGASPSRGPAALELRGPFAHVPSLEELERLTEVPDRRVVFRGVDWSFYDRLVDSIPEGSNIHVDYDGKDLEVMSKGADHELSKRLMAKIVDIVAEEYDIRFAGYGETTWKRPELARGIDADESFFFQEEKIEAAAQADLRDPKNIAGCPNPDLAIEIDISPPATDRASIYAALRVAEIWRFNGRKVIIERLTAEGKYVATGTSGFLPVSADDILRWLVDKDRKNQAAWLRKLRTEIKTRVANQSERK